MDTRTAHRTAFEDRFRGVMHAAARPAARIERRIEREPVPLTDFTLGDWLVQPGLNRVSRGGAVRHLRPQVMDVLACLARGGGRTLAKDEVLEAVWPGRFPPESALARCVTELRQALGDSARGPSRYVQTVSRRGYRVVAPVEYVAKARPPAGSSLSPAAPSDQPASGHAATSAVPAARSVALQSTPREALAPLSARGRWRGRWSRAVAWLADRVAGRTPAVVERPEPPSARVQ